MASAPPAVDERVPVLVLSGWLGAGKTTLLRSILTRRGGLRVGVLVNDMAEVNVDAATMRIARVTDGAAPAGTGAPAVADDGGDVHVLRITDELVELSNGCVCCTLRADFAEQLAALAAATRPDGSRRFEYLVVETSGISEPMAVAEVFDLPPGEGDGDTDGDEVMTADKAGSDAEDGEEEGDDNDDDNDKGDDDDDECALEDGAGEEDEGGAEKAARAAAASAALQRVARLDALVTVVDALNWPADLRTTDSLADRKVAAGPTDGRSVPDLVVEQVEFANVVVLSKTDLVPAADAARVEAVVRALNPTATVVRATRGDAPLAALLHTRAFSIDAARASPGWLRSLAPDAPPHVPESVELGIETTVFRARRPFHPARLFDAVLGAGAPRFACTVRSKGEAFVATPWGLEHALSWSSAGKQLQAGRGRQWWAAMPRAERPAGVEASADWSAASLPGARGARRAPLGDRASELVFITLDGDTAAIQAALAGALLTEAEFAAWARRPARRVDGDEGDVWGWDRADGEEEGGGGGGGGAMRDDDDGDRAAPAAAAAAARPRERRRTAAAAAPAPAPLRDRIITVAGAGGRALRARARLARTRRS